MLPSHFRTVAAAALCAAFAFATARADEEEPPREYVPVPLRMADKDENFMRLREELRNRNEKPAPVGVRKPAVIRLTTLDAAEAANVLSKLMPAKAVVVPIPDENALLLYVTDQELKEIHAILKVCGEEAQPKPASEPKPMPAPKPPGAVQPAANPPAEKGYTVHFKDAEWGPVLEWYAKTSGLKADVRVKPKGKFSCTPGKERHFTIGEITDLINEGLAEQNLWLIPNRKTFAVVSTAEKIDPKLVPAVELEDLPKLARTAIVEVAFPVTFDEPAGKVADELKKLLTPLGEIVSAKGKWVIIRDTVGNVNRIRETLEL